jgi:hypothetical protein
VVYQYLPWAIDRKGGLKLAAYIWITDNMLSVKIMLELDVAH